MRELSMQEMEQTAGGNSREKIMGLNTEEKRRIKEWFEGGGAFGSTRASHSSFGVALVPLQGSLTADAAL